MTTQLHAALRERLDVLEQCWLAADAPAIVEQLYTEQTQITGPGEAPVYQGTRQLTELVGALIAETVKATLRIDHVQPLAQDAAYSWVTWHVQPREGEPFKMKSLFVWERTAEGWRLQADMYAEGEIHL